MEKDSKLQEAIESAIDARENARTFRTKVGISYEMYDGEVIGGFNVETYAHKGYHAEEVGIIRAMGEGYNGTDFKRMVEVFKDPGHEEQEIFPACPYHCWGTLREFTHPYLEIIVADREGEVHYSERFKNLFNENFFMENKQEKMFPSNKTRKTKPKKNIKPKLPLSEELRGFYEEDPNFRKYCETIGVEVPWE